MSESSRDLFESNKSRLVSFFFVGVGKCGTSWIYEFMSRHSLGTVPEIKEPYFLDAPLSKQSSIIDSVYVNGDGLSDFSTLYYWDDENPNKILQHNGDAKIIVTVRKPSERVVSHFGYMKKLGMHKDTSLSTYLESDEDQVLARCDYTTIYDRYRKVFSAENILVLPLEQLKYGPQQYSDRLVAFLGFKPFALSEADLIVVRRAGVARNAHLALIAKSSAILLRKLGMLRALGVLKKSKLVSSLLFQENNNVEKSTRHDFGVKSSLVSELDDKYIEFLKVTGYEKLALTLKAGISS